MRTILGMVVGAVALGGVVPVPSSAQSFRGSATSTVRYLSLQPLVLDTFAFTEAALDPDGFYAVDGRRVYCLRDVQCTAYRLGGSHHAVAATQDLRLTTWGFGVEGLSATAYLRGRRQLDGAYPWPRADNAFDALLAYVQWNRPGLRVRVGRQETLSRLGFASFDGANLRAQVSGWLRVEALAGRSLARGLREPRNEAFRGVEDWVPQNEAYVVGAAATANRASGAAVSLRYQREMWSDRSTLLSERASLEFRTRLPTSVRWLATTDWDFSSRELGKATISAQSRLAPWLDLELRARRYVPYFDLSTIWGFFEPVGYREGRALLGVGLPRGGWTGWVSAAWRQYEEAGTPVVLSPLEDAAWSVDSGAHWSPGLRWSLRGSYRLEWGAGAYLHSGDGALAWRATDRVRVRAHASYYQQLEEFRLGDRRMAGGGFSGSLALGRATMLDGGWLHYAALGGDGVNASLLVGPQTRGWVSVVIPLGADPGVPSGAGR